FDKINGYLADARQNARIIQGGTARDGDGFFVEPTMVETDNPADRLLCEEILGPVVTVHPYADARWNETLALIDQTSPYALTGAIFSQERGAIRAASVGLPKG